ncbi:hypothetical protein [Heliorestis convoluta]|uniref:AAA family ATPase n=1 Tax=Heliorestis convoluta TaxID=356322 RepID=A0A5Q2N6H6_9FIRM|nr:hypothetical protein [Heliorestis convoluta]QGG47870.1 AAA family ATPase [Heliorestis convoluta]
MKDFLAEKLFIFRPERRGDYFYIKDVRLVPKPLSYMNTSTYVTLPLFSKVQHGYSYDDFLKKLIDQELVGPIHAYAEGVKTPPFLLWRDDDHSFFIFGELIEHRQSHNNYAFYYEQLKKISFPEAWFEEAIEVPGNDTLLFLSKEKQSQIYERMKSTEDLIASSKEENSLNDSTLLEQDPNDRLVAMQCWEEKLLSLETKEGDSSESLFIQNFMQITREQGLLYDWKDLIHFHTAMKTSNLVILAGMSGTGKSRLVQAYGKALQLKEDQLAFIPVHPSWNDDADLIGSVDCRGKVYQPGRTG